jgi:succinate dehydrogenase / fumarate reductase cytochrome b subunit
MTPSPTQKQLAMSISGLCLLLFLTLHLAVNLTSIVSREAYEAACGFMDKNSFIRIVVPTLALGFVVHIVLGVILTVRKRNTGIEGYQLTRKTRLSWASVNMLVLGFIVLGLLGFHLSHFWAKVQLQHLLGNEGENPYELVQTLFFNDFYVAMYVVWILVLCFHISHGFWRMLQAMGVANSRWIPRLQRIAYVYSYILLIGFMSIPVYFYLGLSRI